jgi:hypothetical protein
MKQSEGRKSGLWNRLANQAADLAERARPDTIFAPPTSWGYLGSTTTSVAVPANPVGQTLITWQSDGTPASTLAAASYAFASSLAEQPSYGFASTFAQASYALAASAFTNSWSNISPAFAFTDKAIGGYADSNLTVQSSTGGLEENIKLAVDILLKELSTGLSQIQDSSTGSGVAAGCQGESKSADTSTKMLIILTALLLLFTMLMYFHPLSGPGVTPTQIEQIIKSCLPHPAQPKHVPLPHR